MGPSLEQMMDDIQSEFVLDVTFMVTTIAAAWPLIKTHRPSSDDEIVASLLVAQADDLMHPVLDYETPARVAGWKPSEKQPGVIVRDADMVPSWEAACGVSNLEVPIKRPKRIFIIDPQLFAQLALMEEQRLDQNFGGFPVWATWRDEDELKPFCELLVVRRQQEIWQDAIKQARQRFHFTDHTNRTVPFFGRVNPWNTETVGDIQRGK